MTGLKLSVADVRPIRIRELQESAFCLSYDKRGIHILVDRFEDRSKAIFLNGEYAFHCFAVEVVHDWKGLALHDFALIVDANSAVDSENEWPPLGALSIGPNGVQLQVAMKDHHGFTDKIDLKLGLHCPEIAPGLRVSFSRWAFQFGEGDQAQFHWIDAETVK